MDPITLMTCAVLLAVDGDTVKCDGQNLRPMGDGAPFVSGFDAPEIGRFADCPEEHRLDRFGRPLVALRLPDGRTLGSILIAEGLAVEWTPDYRARWCG
mgnify:CR=1 FL=1